MVNKLYVNANGFIKDNKWNYVDIYWYIKGEKEH